MKHQRPSVERVSWVFFFSFLFINLKDAQINTQALHFDWTKQTLRTARVNFSGEMRRTTLIFFYAWPFLKIVCLIYPHNIKNTAIIPSLVLKVATHPEGKKHVLFFSWSSAVNRTSCDSVLILSCICGVTFCWVWKYFDKVPHPGLCDAYCLFKKK